MSCIGLEELPKGEWFCYSCRCGGCGNNQSTDKVVLCCYQCEIKFHPGCSKRNREQRGETWFCSDKCEKILWGLHQLVGKPISVGDGLSWTILKGSTAATEQHSKLNVALALMRECFKPVKEVHTKDLIRDVIFNKGSTLKRLNFRGFYTIILEKGDEMVSAASVRVHSNKVAEVPLVGTQVRYRKQGMCRLLLDTFEKKLAEFGVEELILPAAPQALGSWTSSFGFSQLTPSERLGLVHRIFLNFQDTIMCHKLLLPRNAAAAPLEEEVDMVSCQQVDNSSLKVYTRRKKSTPTRATLVYF